MTLEWECIPTPLHSRKTIYVLVSRLAPSWLLLILSWIATNWTTYYKRRSRKALFAGPQNRLCLYPVSSILPKLPQEIKTVTRLSRGITHTVTCLCYICSVVFEGFRWYSISANRLCCWAWFFPLSFPRKEVENVIKSFTTLVYFQNFFWGWELHGSSHTLLREEHFKL
jgi:hypothetical protein